MQQTNHILCLSDSTLAINLFSSSFSWFLGLKEKSSPMICLGFLFWSVEAGSLWRLFCVSSDSNLDKARRISSSERSPSSPDFDSLCGIALTSLHDIMNIKEMIVEYFITGQLIKHGTGVSELRIVVSVTTITFQLNIVYPISGMDLNMSVSVWNQCVTVTCYRVSSSARSCLSVRWEFCQISSHEYSHSGSSRSFAASCKNIYVCKNDCKQGK